MQYKKKILKNGTRVVLVPVKNTQTVTVQVLVEAGSKYENAENNGISHFLEHMMFKGTKERPSSKAITEELEGVGGEFGAFTSKEQTNYFVKVPKKHWGMALDVVSDIHLNSNLDPKEIEKEKGVIIQEMAMYEDTPMHHIWDIFESLFYGNQPAGWDIIGTLENIKDFKQKDFIDYLEKFYTPESTLIVVSGNFEEKKVLEKIKKYFEEKKSKEKTTKPEVVHNQKRPQIKIHAKETDQTHLVLGTKSVNMFDEDRHAVNVLAAILGGGMSSRMFDELREKRGLAYYVNSGADQTTDSGYFFATAGIKHENLEKTIKLILKEFKKTTQSKIPAKEISKAKEYIKGRTLMSLESSSALASFFGNQEFYYKKMKSPEEVLKKIDAVTAKDIQRVARNIFKDETLNLAIIGPHQNNFELEKHLTFKK